MKNRSVELKNKIKMLYAFIKMILKKYRKWLDKYRNKYPKLHDCIYNTITVSWFLVSTCFVVIQKNALFVTIMMFITFWGVYISQWAILTNKLERKIAEEKEKQESKFVRAKNKNDLKLKNLYNREFNTIKFMHSVAHKVKMQTAQMPHQGMGVTRSKITEFLSESLNSLEDCLTEYYGDSICASIKFCYGIDTIKTYARGQNNISSRGGVAHVEMLNKGEIKIDDNYAYKAIIKSKRKYFSEGDLHKLKEKEKIQDKFYCEYYRWYEIFNASIIIPIRYPNMSDSGVNQTVLGLVCIDSLKKLEEWSNPNKSYAYQMTAFLADILYDLTDQYIKIQQANLKN